MKISKTKEEAELNYPNMYHVVTKDKVYSFDWLIDATIYLYQLEDSLTPKLIL